MSNKNTSGSAHLNFAKPNLGGFTLIEVLVVVGVTVILAAVALLSLTGRPSQTAFENTTRQMAALLREAQSRSMAQASSVGWGVHFENSTSSTPFYALFSVAYSTSTRVGYYALPTAVQYSAATLPAGSSLDVTFAQITGAISSSTAIGVQLVRGGSVASSTVITVSTGGAITY